MGFDGQDGAYVYDFMYYDPRRVASFLAQLSSYGSLTSITHRAGSSEGQKAAAGAKAAGGIPAVATGEATKQDEVTTGHTEALDRQYDPFWVNGLTLYEELDKFSLIQRDISKARIGQFVLVKGNLTILDFNILRSAWKSQFITKIMMPKADALPKNATGEQRRAHKESVEAQEAQFSMSVEILESMPHTVQASVTSGVGAVWCTLGIEGIVSQSAEILLKHGTSIGGNWAMLGILDAKPDDEPLDMSGNLTAQAVADGGTALGTIVAALAPIARGLLGRPLSSYGVTPLLIFREVAAD